MTMGRRKSGEPPRKCGVEGCDRPYHSNGMCNMHHHRWRRGGGKVSVEPNNIKSRCLIPGCTFSYSRGDGLCERHHFELMTVMGGGTPKPRNKLTSTVYTGCKIPGCGGPPNGKGGFIRGFCPKHYNQYRTGIIDIDGNRLRRFKTVGGRTTRLDKIITVFCRARDMVNEAIAHPRDDENERTRDIYRSISAFLRFLDDPVFILNGVELFKNRSIKDMTDTGGEK